jgi:CRP-like cAMP-binding protein
MLPPVPTKAPMADHAELPAPEKRPIAARRHSAALTAPPRILARPFFREGDGMRPIENLLSQKQAEALMDIAELLDYPRGRTIYGQGGEATHLYSIASGCVRVSHTERDGARQILAFMWPGDLTGLAENGRYVNTAETVQQTRLFGFRTADLLRLMERDPQLKLQLLVKTAHELRRAQRMMTVLGQRKTDQRLASFLLELAREGHSFDGGRREIMLPMSRFDIADYLGSSPETVARAFASLEEAGVVKRVSPRTLRIPDLAALEQHIRASHPRRAVPA